jgi:squalene-associated FAD-dependent desaturase
MPGPRLAVVGGGWAGLAAAVEGTLRGAQVTVFEMAPQLGGRAREVQIDGLALDNGQHILIGAYVQTLQLLRTVGVDTARAFVRTPLRIGDASGNGLYLPGGPPLLAFARAVLGRHGWRAGDKAALLTHAACWALRGFRCDPALTVDGLTRGMPAALREDLIDPLCVAALNTPALEASAAVFLRVLKDALFSGAGSADLLLPRVSLGELLPAPAARWLSLHAARVMVGHRVQHIDADAAGCRIDGEAFDAAVLACSSVEAARLSATVAPSWSAQAAAVQHEPIVTLYARSAAARLPEPMLSLRSSPDAPAQFVFDRGQLGGPAGLLAFVISGAQPWVDAGSDATIAATLRQGSAELAPHLPAPLQALRLVTEKRATFRCTPGHVRVPMAIAPRLCAAADYVQGPYPATLEGAVRSGIAAARGLV